MKNKFVRQALSAVVALTMLFTSAVPAYATDISNDPASLLTSETEENVVVSDNANSDVSIVADKTDQNENDGSEDDTLIPDNNETPDGEKSEDVNEDNDQESEELPEIIQSDEELVGDAPEQAKVTVNYWLYDWGYGDRKQLLCSYETADGVYPELRDEDVNFEQLMRGYTFDGWYQTQEYWVDNENENESEKVKLGETNLSYVVNGVTDIFAHWSRPDISIKINTGDHARYKFVPNPDLYILEKPKAGDDVFIRADYNETYKPMGHLIEVDEGYYIENLYLDAEYSKKLPTLYDYDTYSWDFNVSGDVLSQDESGNWCIQLYAKVLPYKVELRVYDRNYNGKKVLGTYDLGDTFPNMPSVQDINGSTFDGWRARGKRVESPDNETNRYGFVDIVPGETKISDARIYRDYSKPGLFYVEAEIKWIPKKYTIRFHINDGRKDDIVETYVCDAQTAGHTPLEVSTETGVVSGNSSFTDNAVKFSGWALTPKGEVVFDKGLTAAAVRQYVYDQQKYDIDLYAKWEGSEDYRYTLDIQAFNEDDLQKLDMSKESFEGSEYVINSKDDLVQHDKSYLNETIIMTGNEFVRQGYVLDGWNYTVTANGKTTTKKLKAASNIKETVKPESAVLTAIWKPVSYNVKYNLAGGALAVKGTKTAFSYDKSVTADKTALLNYKIEENGTVTKTGTDVVRAGYAFDGWFAENTSYEYYGGDLYQNLTLTAKWSPVNYTIRLEANGGIIRTSDGREVDFVQAAAAYNQTIPTKGITATRPGYKFKNWSGQVMGTNKSFTAGSVLKNLSVTGETVYLKAQWTPNTNTITYNLDGGVLPKNAAGKKQTNPSKYYTGEGTVDLVAPDKTGFVFDHWELSQKGVSAGNETASLNNERTALTAESYGNVTLKAVYEPVNYAINVHMNLDDAFAEGSEDYNVRDYSYTKENIKYSDNLTLDGYAKVLENKLTADAQETRSIIEFNTLPNGKGKKYNLTSAYSKLLTTGTLDLYAQWSTKKVYRILYDLDGGTLSRKTTTYTPAAAVKITSPTRVGYVFEGWTVKEVVENGNSISTGDEVSADAFETTVDKNKNLTILKNNKKDVYLVANWSPISYSVVLDGENKGDFYYQNTAEHSNGSLQIEPVKTGYVYKGIYTAVNGKGSKINTTEDVTTGKLIVTLGADSLTGLSTKNGATVKLFTYWTADTRSVEYNEIAYVDNLSLYDLDVREHVGVLNANAASNTYTFGKDMTLPKLNVPGYTFLGWKIRSSSYPYYTDDLGNVKATVNKGYITKINKNNNENVSLTAVLKENTYSIKVNLGGGTYTRYEGNGRKTYTGTFLAAQGLFSEHYTSNAYYSIQDFINGYNMSKKGYTFRGVYLDAKGTKPVPTDETGYDRIVTKDKGILTVYVLWDKVAPSKPSKVSATLADGNLTVKVGDNNADRMYYQVEYSTGMLFSKSTTWSKMIYPGENGTVTITGATATRYYVRVKAFQKDSTGNRIYSGYSSTIRAKR
ncbi:InlB B-repeat-containing protein [Butyrivibrio proteoclasticus]|uniref:InlB B-repeat-containing protein n=1 Tax=Butyrivibrio proteoclasticus TaxID=43305 RepID=UPI00047A2C08|nr:InlB B-repeat-containing protein [Butyrivibrio proteoclasticus]